LDEGSAHAAIVAGNDRLGDVANRVVVRPHNLTPSKLLKATGPNLEQLAVREGGEIDHFGQP
jgi:hypothetical protein